MKKLGKLTISPEKIMKNKELINLQGGYGDPGCVLCMCGDYSFWWNECYSTKEEMFEDILAICGPQGGGCTPTE